ncbi:sensor histidine kinase [Paracidovorax avenae]|uniref:sensor histidine kinase n=1 Tax=Paracidovorax avenae TaxID=80867 RepID=UPI0006B35ACB|nr:sensor histidine kinase [Paracidovorax avenae]
MTRPLPWPLRGANSLRRKLVAPLLWTWIASAVVASLAAFWLTGRATQLVLDRVLRDDAVALASQIQWNPDGPVLAIDARTASSMVYDSFAPSHFTLRTDDGAVLAGNAELALPQQRGDREGDADGSFFFEHDTPWGRLRQVAVHARHAGSPGVWVIVGESVAKRQVLTRELAQSIFLPVAVLGFVIVPLVLFGVRRGLQPARAVGDAMGRRGIDDLSPLPLEDVPDELRSMVQHTNDLLRRLGESVDSERRFISDAAHQLRTPVAGIHLLVEDLRRVYQADPGQPPDAEVLFELHSAADRATRLVRQLLSLAHGGVDAGAAVEPVALAPLALRAMERYAAAAAEAGKSVEAGDGLREDGYRAQALALPLLLEEALANVLDNAIRYGGRRIRVDLVAEPGLPGGGWCLQVDDDGPPLPQAHREAMLAPFWRAGESGSEGSGLGLPIALKALRRMGGDLPVPEVPPGGGTRVRLLLRAT